MNSVFPKKSKIFRVGQWVMYFNPRKLRGRQMKWVRQHEGPFLIVKMFSAMTAKIQQTPKATPKTVQIDKLKHSRVVRPAIAFR